MSLENYKNYIMIISINVISFIFISQQAGIGGAAHLVNFESSDTLSGFLMAQKYYDCPMAGRFDGGVSEHSTMTSWGRESEIDVCRNMLEKFPDGACIVVSD